MGQKYRQLTFEERCEIARLSKEGRSIRKIAAALDREASTIAREIKRNSGNDIGYRPSHAQQRHQARRWSGSRLDRSDALRENVFAGLAAGWSPEQVAARLEMEQGKPCISPESIYRFVHAQITRHGDYSWRHLLPRAKFKRGWRGTKGGSPALHMAHRVPLSERPLEAENRAMPGHWEADLMSFSRYGQHLLLLHERTSRILIAQRLETKQAVVVAETIHAMLAPMPQPLLQTITFDNGTEFARHYDLHALNLKTYFCNTHSPWQKGGIENAIGRMRRFLPRKTDITAISDQRLTEFISAYNNTPRKCLDFKTPAELFSDQLLHFKCESTLRPAPQ
jgi:transposase, IS30 family